MEARFSRDASHTVIKTITLTSTSSQAVVLTSSDVSALGDGTISVSVTQSDSAGNTSTVTTAFVLDTTPPVITITTPIATDNAVSAAEATAGVTIAGTAEANASVTLTLYQVTKTVTANASGAWTATFDAADWDVLGVGRTACER